LKRFTSARFTRIPERL